MRRLQKISFVAPIAALVLGLSAAAATAAPMRSFPHGGGGVGGGRAFHEHGGFGRGFGAGALGGFAAGAAVGYAFAPGYYGYGYGYDDYGYGNCYQYNRVYDRWGRYLGVRLVDICE
jgi:hypothetical protein